MIRIFLIDDHRLLRLGIKKLISEQEDMQVIAEFNQGKKVLQEIPKYNPNVIICDISLPDIDGIELAKSIKERYPEVRVLMLSMHKDSEHVKRAVEVQVDGYLHKDIFDEEVIEGIKAVQEGDRYFSRAISQVMINDIFSEDSKGENNDISEREQQVLQLISDGFTNKEIADQLHISIKTVDKHRTHLLQKLNAKNTAEMVKQAFKQQLIQ